MTRTYPSDWTARQFQHISTRNNRETSYELELIEFNFSDSDAPILLMVPGYFQNAFIFDLLPEKNISLARYINKHFHYHIFVLHPNGIGQSDYIKKSDLDDIAIDDIAGAIKLLRKSYQKEIFLLGHSNGAINIQCYLSGLTRSDSGNVFNQSVSKVRQADIEGVVLFGGNVCMSDDNDQSGLKKISRFGVRIRFILKRIGWINARLLTRFISPTKVFGNISVAYWRFWEFLYHIENVSNESRKAVYDLTLDGTSAATLIQYSLGVVNGCIHSTGYIKYADGLQNIHIPVTQTTFELDPLAVPESTRRDSFDKLSSPSKLFVSIPQQGHEDFMMNANLHDAINASFEFINASKHVI